MTDQGLKAVLLHIRAMVNAERTSGLTDADLLQRFAAERDEDAFAALLQRHAAVVWNVCWHVLGRDADVEDAFQATFLVLARKAGSIRKKQSVGSWLHGVAHRIALRARRDARRREALERKARARPLAPPVTEAAWRHLQEALDAEVARLPEKLRAPFVLCHLQGKSVAEAARLLGWKIGTVTGRLTQARKSLERALARKGITLAAALSALALGQQGTSAGVPALVAANTVKAATVFAVHGTTAGVSANAIALANGCLQSAIVLKGKAMVLLFLILGAAFAPVTGVPPGKPPPEAKPFVEKIAPVAQTPRLDAFGDPLPADARARIGTLQLRQGGWITALAFVPGSKLLASAGGDDMSRFWDPITGKEVRRFYRYHGGNLNSLAFSRDGSVMVSSGGGIIRLWDVKAGRDTRLIEQPARSVSLSSDGRLLASAGEDVRIWEVATGKLLRTLPAQKAEVIETAFSPDGKALGSSHLDGTVRLWNLAGGKPCGIFKHGKEAFHVAFSPDGAKLVSSGADGGVSLWDVSTHKRLHHWPTKREPQVAFSPDGKIFAIAVPGNIELRNVASGQIIRNLVRRRFAIWNNGSGFAFSADGKLLAQADGCAIRIWDLARAKEIGPPNQTGHVTFALSHDGKLLATADDGPVISLRDPMTGKERRTIPNPKPGIEDLKFSADDSHLTWVNFSWTTYNGEYTVHRWDLRRAKEDLRLKIPRGYLLDGDVMVDLEAGKRRTKADPKSTRLRDLANGRQLKRLPWGITHESQVAFSRDRTMLAAANDHSVVWWNLPSGKELGRFQSQKSLGGWHSPSLAFTPDGRHLAVNVFTGGGIYGPTGYCHFLDVVTGKIIRTFQDTGIFIAFSPDGTLLVTESSADPTVARLIEVSSGREIHNWQYRESSEGEARQYLFFSADGRTLFSFYKKTVRLWETVTGKERHVFQGGHEGPVWWPPQLSRDGKTLVSRSLDTTVLIWDATGLSSLPASPPRKRRDLDQLWQDLGSEDAHKAYRAVWQLAAAPRLSVPFLRERLRPAVAADARAVARWIGDLDSTSFQQRTRAERELENLHERVEPALRKALHGNRSLEARRRLEQLLKKLETWHRDPEQIRPVRAVEVLEHIGTAESHQLLQVLAQGAPEGRLTREARRAVAVSSPDISHRRK